jgi:hypothetical protein
VVELLLLHTYTSRANKKTNKQRKHIKRHIANTKNKIK